MGTNIYLVKQIKEKDIETLKDIFNTSIQNLQTSEDISEVLYPLEDFLNSLKEEIHICKRSGGWQLLFQSHKELYECTWKSMTDYIKKVTDNGTYKMIDEYGKPYSLEDLKSDLDYFSKGHTGKTYDEEQVAKGKKLYVSQSNFEYISDGLRWTDSWFC